MGLASVGITFASGYLQSPLTNFVFYSNYGYGFPLPWKSYPALEIPCNTQNPGLCQVPAYYSPLYFALDCLFYTAVAYLMLFVYIKSHARKPPAAAGS